MYGNISSLIAWYITILLLGFLMLPITFRIFKHLPDRGYSFSKPVALLLTGYAFWFLASTGLAYNDAGGIFLAILLLVALSIFLNKKKGLLEIRDWLFDKKETVIFIELLFLISFAGWALVRAYNPDIYGTEKPMEYMFINSILHSPTFPPQDAWLSNYAISYYYFGYVLVALLTRITGTPSSVSFNLGIALLFSMAVVSSLGILLNLIAITKKANSNSLNDTRTLLKSSLWPALLGPVMVLIVGNWYGGLEYVHDHGLLDNIKIPMIWYDFGKANDVNNVKSFKDFSEKPGLKAGMIGIWDWLDIKQLDEKSVGTANANQWDVPNWFYSARVIHDRNLIGIETEAIDEVPAFSFLLADMHPHVLALPYVIVAIGLALEWFLLAAQIPPNILSSRKKFFFPWDQLILTVILIGGLLFLNTWDFPIYVFLLAISFLVGLGSNWGLSTLIANWKYPFLFLLIIFVCGLLFYWPFLLTFQSQAGGLLPNLIYPSRFQQIIVMFGPVLFGISVFTVWLFIRKRSFINRLLAVWVGLGTFLVLSTFSILMGFTALRNPATMNTVQSTIYPLQLSEAISLVWQRRLIDSLTSLFSAIIIGMAVSIIFSTIHRVNADSQSTAVAPERTERSPLLMVLGMILTGGLLLIGPEFVYLRDNFGTRMNTLFKFYFQIWVLWGLASGFGIWYIWQSGRRWFRIASSLAFCVCGVIGAYYLVGGLASKTGFFSNPPNLDGMAYFSNIFSNDWKAIQWLQQNARDGQVILEGSKGAYWIEGQSSRFSMATGLPTVMGWYNHEAQWRGESIRNVDARLNDIQTIYQSKDWEVTQKLLDEYQIQYVIVSSLERNWYKPVYTAKFDRFMVPVFKSGDVTVYSR